MCSSLSRRRDAWRRGPSRYTPASPQRVILRMAGAKSMAPCDHSQMALKAGAGRADVTGLVAARAGRGSGSGPGQAAREARTLFAVGEAGPRAAVRSESQADVLVPRAELVGVGTPGHGLVGWVHGCRPIGGVGAQRV